MRFKYQLFVLLLVVIGMWSCSNAEKSENDEVSTEQVQRYQAELQALNAEIAGTETFGKASFVIKGDTMVVHIAVLNAPPSIEHWQHFHGFPDGTDAACVTADMDENGDGIIDVVETEVVSGTTMVPFNAFPVKMDLGADTYPVADEEGHYNYSAQIPMDKLEEAFKDAFGGDGLELDKRVLYIHGVPLDTELPESVASVHDIPAQVTLPIACGKIIRVEPTLEEGVQINE